MNELKPTATDIESLKLFPFIDATLMDQLRAELPAYLAAADDVTPDVETLSWWKNHQNQIPTWAKAFKIVLLVQPSFVAAKRVFSLLQNSFSHQQRSSLENYISVSVMLQYNRK